jgi:hypothetical protein
MSTITSKVAFGLVLTVAAMTSAMPGVSAQNAAVEEFTAFAINTNDRPTGPNRQRTGQLTITINRWSTDDELKALQAIILEEQDTRRMNDAALRALERMPPVGRIRESNTLGWDLRFARQAAQDEGGRQILIATDRPIPFWEARDQPRSFDYRFTVLDMRLDKQNEGSGKMLADTRLLFDRKLNNLVLEHYDLQPVRLNQIRRRN